MDPEEMARMMAALEQRVAALETARRAPFTTVRGGVTRWLDENEEEAVAIGVDTDGFIRAWNADRTAPLFEVRAGAATFPLTASAWQPVYSATLDATTGYRHTTTTLFIQPLWSCILSLVTDRVRWEFDVLPDVGWTGGELAIGVTLLDPATGDVDGSEVITTVNDSLTGTSPQNVDGVLTIPDSIVDGNDPAGHVVRLYVYARRTSGTSGVGVAPLVPAWCIT